MKTSEKLIATLCDPEGKVCIEGSDEDRRILQKAIVEVQELERMDKYTIAYLHADLMEELYDNELNFELSCFWDGGYTARLGDEMNGFTERQDCFMTPLQAMEWLVEMAKKHYPKTKFKY